MRIPEKQGEQRVGPVGCLLAVFVGQMLSEGRDVVLVGSLIKHPGYVRESLRFCNNHAVEADKFVGVDPKYDAGSERYQIVCFAGFMVDGIGELVNHGREQSCFVAVIGINSALGDPGCPCKLLHGGPVVTVSQEYRKCRCKDSLTPSSAFCRSRTAASRCVIAHSPPSPPDGADRLN